MLKEVALKVYLFVIQLIFRLFSYLPLRQRTVMLSSFGDNLAYISSSLYAKNASDIIVLKEESCQHDFKYANKTINFSPKHPLSFIIGIFYLATSKMIFVDNYHVVLAACDFKKDVVCTQVWHANGAVKYFGWRDKTIINRPTSAHKRFQAVYARFNKVVVSSDDMAYIFKQAFGLKDKNILKTGLPRTDYYFDQEQVRADHIYVRAQLNLPLDKKVILYAPTYRDNELDNCQLSLDVNVLSQALGGYHLLVKLHPAVSQNNKINNSFVTDVSDGYRIEKLMAASDLLITDYSSIPFEYCLLNKPMYFYTYDMEEYKKLRGIWFDFKSYMPGPVAKNEAELIDHILNDKADLTKVANFNKRVNQYADGHSSDRLVETLYE